MFSECVTALERLIHKHFKRLIPDRPRFSSKFCSALQTETHAAERNQGFQTPSVLLIYHTATPLTSTLLLAAHLHFSTGQRMFFLAKWCHKQFYSIIHCMHKCQSFGSAFKTTFKRSCQVLLRFLDFEIFECCFACNVRSRDVCMSCMLA